jgi:hypothetical protein
VRMLKHWRYDREKAPCKKKGSSEAMEMEQHYKMRWEPDPGSAEYDNTKQQEPSSPTPAGSGNDTGNNSNDDLSGSREEFVRSAECNLHYTGRRHPSATPPLSLSLSPFAVPPPQVARKDEDAYRHPLLPR